jgi:creatinine amidohydrolase/Fe(II)-dependent formamide hydrolase-like protein
MPISHELPKRTKPLRTGLFCFLLLAVVPSAHSAVEPTQVMLEEMTTSELEARIHAGATTLLVPIGGVEQSGPDIALGKHDARARILAEKIARVLGNAVVAPVVSYVPEGSVEHPAGHMRFAGTISIPIDAFEATLEGAAESLHLHGIREVVFLGDHGGYQKELHQAASVLSKRWAADGAKAVALDAYYRAAAVDFPRYLKAQGYSDAEIGTHAGLADASLTLALEPELVRADHLAADARRGAQAGIYGDASRASAALGAVGVKMIVDQSVAAIRFLQAP